MNKYFWRGFADGWALGALCFAGALGLNYAAALLGNPQSLWLMRDILGWM